MVTPVAYMLVTFIAAIGVLAGSYVVPATVKRAMWRN
jgi:hypothetical protein